MKSTALSSRLCLMAGRFVWRACTVLVALALLGLSAGPAFALVSPEVTIQVNTNLDPAPANDGVCTLREAIVANNTNTMSGASLGECAAGTTGLDTISFDTTLGVFQVNATIAPGSDLPPVTAPVVISGKSVYDYGGLNHWVKLNGPVGSGTALTFAAGSQGSVLDRLIVTNWFSGVVLESGGVTVTNSRFGVDFNGTSAGGNIQAIRVSSSSNMIGGLDASGASRMNLISGNNTGILVLSGSNNVIQSNWIGTTAAGNTALGNYGAAISVGPSAVNTLIGGAIPKQGNVISGNYAGVDIDSGARSTKIVRNWFGIGANGLSSLGNQFAIRDFGGVGTLIGGKMPQASNIFGFNTQYGVYLNDAAHTGTITISGNIMGRRADGGAAGNYGAIFVSNSPLKALIKGNLIASSSYGVDLASVNSGLIVVQNCITGNAPYGAFNSSGVALDVHGNWWGSASGPNPPGSGDAVTTLLTAAPWLTKPPTSCLAWSPKSVTPKDQTFWMPKTTPITLKWSKVPTAADYAWFLGKDGGLYASAIHVQPPGSAGALDYGLYSWFNVTFTFEGVTWQSPSHVFYVTIQKSPKPGAVVTPVFGNITFAWNAYPAATGYTLSVYTSADCSTGGTNLSVSTTSDTVGPWSAGTHSWQVTANPVAVTMPCWSFMVP